MSKVLLCVAIVVALAIIIQDFETVHAVPAARAGFFKDVASTASKTVSKKPSKGEKSEESSWVGYLTDDFHVEEDGDEDHEEDDEDEEEPEDED
ncbi:parathymosin-like [Phlebotomus papatasi]|uniref:parathymosin-like n=1 Tax=Phlebotomus papatasi TaxID=29031 RepID=UPI002483B300|nr:parathymosin-like [Phlebotomus papatasi]